MGKLCYTQNDLDGNTNPLTRPEDRDSSDETGSSVITVFPKPIIPCYFCNSEQYGLVRFLNAVTGYPLFLIYINNQLAVNGLNNGELSQYGRVSAGQQTITLVGEKESLRMEKQIPITSDLAVTVAVINTDSGLDLVIIEDPLCSRGITSGCFRVCNLSVTNPKVDVALNGGVITFQNINYKNVTDFQYLLTGYYTISVSNSNVNGGKTLLTTHIYIRGNAAYILYVFNWSHVRDAIRILIVEDLRH